MTELLTRSGGASKAQDETEEEAKGVDRDNPPGEARAPSTSERVAFLNATHRVEGHCAKDDIGVQSEEATSKKSDEEAKKVDPDNSSGQAAASPSRNLEESSLSEASEVRGESVRNDSGVQGTTGGSDGDNTQVQQSSPSGEGELQFSPTTPTNEREEEPKESISPGGAVEATAKVEVGDQSDSSTGSRAEASEKSAYNLIINIMDQVRAEADKRAAEADRRAAEFQADFNTKFNMLLAASEQQRNERASMMEEFRSILGVHKSSMERAQEATDKSIEDLKTDVGARIEEVELSQEASIKLIDTEDLKINVEVEHSQETTIKIIKDLEDNVKVEQAQERRKVQADDTFRGSLPKDPWEENLFCTFRI